MLLQAPDEGLLRSGGVSLVGVRPAVEGRGWAGGGVWSCFIGRRWSGREPARRGPQRPRRLLEDVNAVARGSCRSSDRPLSGAGELHPARYDAVATQDTVIQLRAAIRKLLTAPPTGTRLRGRRRCAPRWSVMTMTRPWASHRAYLDDRPAREALVDGGARCATARPRCPQERMARRWPDPVAEAAGLLALVACNRPRSRRGRGVSYRPEGGPGSGDLHRRRRGPARAQVPGAHLRRLQNPPRR